MRLWLLNALDDKAIGFIIRQKCKKSYIHSLSNEGLVEVILLCSKWAITTSDMAFICLYEV